jgi:hypothetical protein
MLTNYYFAMLGVVFRAYIEVSCCAKEATFTAAGTQDTVWRLLPLFL